MCVKVCSDQMSRTGEPRSICFMRLGEAEFAVISAPMAPRALPGNLTAAEASVLSAVALGRSNRQIAAERQTSIRTVANQVASLYRKVRVASRAELVLQLVQGWREEKSPPTSRSAPGKGAGAAVG
jgi:DNA-binding NarL/FixJ family response regulator